MSCGNFECFFQSAITVPVWGAVCACTSDTSSVMGRVGTVTCHEMMRIRSTRSPDVKSPPAVCVCRSPLGYWSTTAQEDLLTKALCGTLHCLRKLDVYLWELDLPVCITCCPFSSLFVCRESSPPPLVVKWDFDADIDGHLEKHLS